MYDCLGLLLKILLCPLGKGWLKYTILKNRNFQSPIKEDDCRVLLLNRTKLFFCIFKLKNIQIIKKKKSEKKKSEKLS